MKKLIVTCAIIAFGTVVSFAQSAQIQPNGTHAQKVHTPIKQTPQELAQNDCKYYQQQIKLNDMQFKGTYDASVEMYTQLIAIRNANPTKDMVEENQKLMSTRDQKFKAILSEQQYNDYMTIRTKGTLGARRVK